MFCQNLAAIAMAGKRFGQGFKAFLEAAENKMDDLASKLERNYPKTFQWVKNMFANPASIQGKYNLKTKTFSGVISEVRFNNISLF